MRIGWRRCCCRDGKADGRDTESLLAIAPWLRAAAAVSRRGSEKEIPDFSVSIGNRDDHQKSERGTFANI